RSIRERNPATRVILVTGHGDVSTASQALRARADDYILKPFQVSEVTESVERALRRRQALEQRITMQKELERQVSRLQDEVKKQFSGGVAALATALEARDPYTKGHSMNVAAMSLHLAKGMGWDQQMCDEIAVGALLHDIGKIAVPDEILRKEGALSSEEFGKIKQHARAGHEILLPLFGQGPIAQCALYHHERWDGQGYPEGIAGNKCPLAARTIALCDAYEAMTSERPYRHGLPESKAISEIRANRGRQFDPDVADLFIATRPDLALPDRTTHTPSPL
ncbi:HD domain-containing protein, partial [Candidatus Sumerlaeota bacterium]|nr:HD domain-containing protein [Candidatus Sumerlaeota bacterium]